jgi:(2R)-3-sulfolactate dehydrogenase (NADP+)
VRLPGDRRLGARKQQKRGIAVPTAVVDTVRRYAAEGSPQLRKARS